MATNARRPQTPSHSYARKSRGLLATVALFTLGLMLADSASARLFERRASAESAPGAPPFGDPSTAQTRTINVDGVSRTYLIQPARGGGAAAPIVVMLHGGTQGPEDMWKETSMPTVAQQNNFIVVAPAGLNKHWNDGRGAVLGGKASKADDVGFLRAVIQQVVQQDHGNPNAVFMFGPSNGGAMTQHFACAAGDVLHAAANLISNLPTDEQRDCKNAKPLPWLSINGTSDPLFPFLGQRRGVVKNGEEQPELLSAEQTFSFWADRARCSQQLSNQRVGGTDDQHYTEKRVRGGCAGGAQSVEYIVHGAGHTMPGRPIKSLLVRHYIGDGSTDVDTGTVVWDFFRSTLSGG
ncbi:MAG: hypothetical protein JWR16_824 [Nevskia sp.]|nr:hypothetical protein [Nevskia sp.]